MPSSPTFSIVTPVYNGDAFLQDCLDSIAEQTYRGGIEHIVIDGGSTDKTVNILKRHAKSSEITKRSDIEFRWVSEDDDGMYDAIEKGFNCATGDIYSWLNADDRYWPWTCKRVVGEMGRDDREWVTGHPALIDTQGVLRRVDGIRREYRREWIRAGYYYKGGLGYLRQESMFWTSELWNKAGGFPDGVKVAGDWWLWRQFAEEAELYTIPSVLGALRRVPGQLSSDQERYLKEIDTSWQARLLGLLNAERLYSGIAGSGVLSIKTTNVAEVLNRAAKPVLKRGVREVLSTLRLIK